MKRWPFAIAGIFLLFMNLRHQSDAKVDWHDPTSAVLFCGYIICAALWMASGNSDQKGPSE